MTVPNKKPSAVPERQQSIDDIVLASNINIWINTPTESANAADELVEMIHNAGWIPKTEMYEATSELSEKLSARERTIAEMYAKNRKLTEEMTEAQQTVVNNLRASQGTLRDLGQMEIKATQAEAALGKMSDEFQKLKDQMEKLQDSIRTSLNDGTLLPLKDVFKDYETPANKNVWSKTIEFNVAYDPKLVEMLFGPGMNSTGSVKDSMKSVNIASNRYKSQILGEWKDEVPPYDKI